MSSFSTHLLDNHGHAGAESGQGCGANTGPDPRPGGAGPCRPQGDHYHSNDCPSDLVGMVVAHRGSIKAFLRHLLNLGVNKVALTDDFTLVLILVRRLTHDNAKGILSGWSSATLSARDRLQARLLGIAMLRRRVWFAASSGL